MRLRVILGCLLMAALSACSSAPNKRVSPPAASISELRVDSDGQWQLQLRLQNHSGMSMRFDAIELELHSGNEQIARISAQPALSVGAESADIHTLTLTPDAQARLLAASVLADRTALPYELTGQVQAAAGQRKVRSYPISHRSTLYPAPGLPGVLR